MCACVMEASPPQVLQLRAISGLRPSILLLTLQEGVQEEGPQPCSCERPWTREWRVPAAQQQEACLMLSVMEAIVCCSRGHLVN